MRQVYLSLLRMYLSPPSVHCLGPIKLELLEPQANLQAALQVLELHHSKLDTTKVGASWGDGACRGAEGGGVEEGRRLELGGFGRFLSLSCPASLCPRLCPHP